MMKRLLLILISMLFVIQFCPVCVADDEAGEQIKWQVITAGGTFEGESENYQVKSTLSQTAVGAAKSNDYIMRHGFWQYSLVSENGCCHEPGDANNNGAVNILDITFTIAYLYKGGPEPVCMDQADASGNNRINILDITYTIAYLLHGGSAPICGTTGI
ncbi:MAG: dockerin type I repeat-containing protein [Candidatus Zixiibacteriota bacterium]